MDTDTLAARASSPTHNPISASAVALLRPRAVSNVPASQTAAGASHSMAPIHSLPRIRNSVPIIILLAICAVLMAFAAILTGCSSTSGSGTFLGGTLTPERVQAIAKLATYVGVTADLQSAPQHRIAYERSSVGLQVLVDQERWDTTAVATALMAAGVTELRGSEGSLYMTGGLMLMDAFGIGSYDMKEKAHAKAVVLGVHEGLKLALGTPALPALSVGKGAPAAPATDPMEALLRAEAVATRRLR